jgi:lambda family phage portal protein
MWLDDVIGVFSPAAGARRKFARFQMEQADALARGYDAAKTGRRTDGWISPSSSADSEIGPQMARIRDRARDLVRNNPYAAKAKNDYANYVIGSGMTPLFRMEETDRQKYKDVWNAFQDEADASGLEPYSGIQALVAGAEFESGECFIRFRNRLSSDRLYVPLQLEVLEADYLDTSKDGVMNGTNRIIQGIEYDALNRRVAYWMHRDHPGNMSRFSSLTSTRVPAEDVVHVFSQRRPGQGRGVSAFAPVALKMFDLAGYEDAELVRKKITACYVAFVTQMGSSVSPLSPDSKQPMDPVTGDRKEKMKPGMVGYLRPGEEVKFGNPPSDTGFREYMNTELHAVAAGLFTTFELMTGDLSQVNYSSMRGGMLAFRRGIERIQYNLYVHRLIKRVEKRLHQTAFIAGKIPDPNGKIIWTPPPMDMVDPLKDTQAEVLAIRNGLQSWRTAVTRQGYDPDDVLEEIQQSNAAFDAKNITVDSDPRVTNQAGAAQAAVQSDNHA